MDDKETYLKAIHEDLMWIRQITVGEFIILRGRKLRCFGIGDECPHKKVSRTSLKKDCLVGYWRAQCGYRYSNIVLVSRIESPML